MGTNIADWSRFWDNFNRELYIKILMIKHNEIK